MTDTLASWHPFIVHFAVAFAIGSAAFDILDFFFQRKQLETTGYHLLLAALPFLLFAVLTGNLAETRIPDTVWTAAALDRHMTYANVAVWVFSAVGLWRVFLHLRKQYNGGRKIFYIFIVTAAAMSVYLAATHGGKIRHGEGFPAGQSPQATVLDCYPGIERNDQHSPYQQVGLSPLHDTAELQSLPSFPQYTILCS